MPLDRFCRRLRSSPRNRVRVSLPDISFMCQCLGYGLGSVLCFPVVPRIGTDLGLGSGVGSAVGTGLFHDTGRGIGHHLGSGVGLSFLCV